MHQEHNIPWNTLVSNLTYIHNNRAVTPQRAGLFPKDPSCGFEKQKGYFIKCFAKTISQFAETERAKYPDIFDYPSSGKLFPDELLGKHLDLNTTTQRIEYWIPHSENGAYYHYGLGLLITALIVENQLATALMLAHHPLIPLRSCADHLTFTGVLSYGIQYIADSALSTYLFFNIAAAGDILCGGEYVKMGGYRHVMLMQDDTTRSSDISFMYEQPGASQVESWWDEQRQQKVREYQEKLQELEPLRPENNITKLGEYLKELFAQLYRYEVFAREVGRGLDWEYHVSLHLDLVLRL